MKNIAIIPSGGIGSRFNSPIPKQYIKVLGKEIIVYTLDIFQNCNLIDEIIIPAEENYFSLLENLINKYNFSKVSKVIKGGKERQDSVFNGLCSKKFSNDDYISVHDAARPLLSKSTLEKALKEAHKYDSIVVGIKARDTLISGIDSVEKYINRNKIYYAQTPQVFKYEILKKSFDIANKNKFRGTDESMIVKNAGFNVKIVEGEFINFKITTENDLILLKKFLA